MVSRWRSLRKEKRRSRDSKPWARHRTTTWNELKLKRMRRRKTWLEETLQTVTLSSMNWDENTLVRTENLELEVDLQQPN